MLLEFIEQFKTMERWYKRLQLIYDKVPKDMGDLEDRDDVLSFFQNCYHLKDWVKNDDGCCITESEIEDFVNSSEYLTICGGICAGSKHLKISDPRFDENTKINRSFYLESSDVKSPINKRTFVVVVEDKNYDALKLADRCMEEWRNFFKEKGYSWS